MVTPGKEPTPYAGQGDAEVALALPESEASLAGIQFEEEPAITRWAVSGAFVGAKLHGTVTSATGATADLDPVALKDEPLQFGELNFGKIEGQPLGAFRINTAVFDSAGEQISPWAEQVVLLVKKPRFWHRQAPESAPASM